MRGKIRIMGFMWLRRLKAMGKFMNRRRIDFIRDRIMITIWERLMSLY